MRVVLQRVVHARVLVEEKVVGEIGEGLLVYVAAHREDTESNVQWIADRIRGVRLFNDSEGKINLNAESAEKPEILLISNFTLLGDATKNRRPSFTQSAPYDEGARLFTALACALREMNLRVETGIFGADMQVESLCDGPVNLVIDG